MIERAYIHVAGPKGAGKTTLIEGIFRAFDGETIAVGCDRDDRLDGMRESKGARDPDVRRYRAAGATGAARVRFPGKDVEAGAFFESDVMCDYSQAVVVEGDCPLGYVDLEVFVAPLLPPGAALLRRTGPRPRATAKTIEEPFVGAGDRAGASLPKDTGTRKALARIKRAIHARVR